jgi:hypothetical protein
MTRVLRLTLLAPDIVEPTPNGAHAPEVTLARVLEPCQRTAGSSLFCSLICQYAFLYSCGVIDV